MAAMMLPSELPLFRLAHATSRSRRHTTALAAGYATVWLVIGMTAMPAPMLPAAWVLGAAAIYQLTPLKRRCLAICRTPLARVLHGWRDGVGGAFRMGIVNGVWCVGCCIGLTAVLVAVGMTSIWLMLLLATFIFVEKTTRVGAAASRLAAVGLAVAAVTL